MMESMNLKDVMNFFKNYISPALEAKYIAMQYPDSPKHPNQKYYLTDLGKSLFGHQSKADNTKMDTSAKASRIGLWRDESDWMVS